MARTKDQSFVNRYLNQYQSNQQAAVSAGQQTASSAANSGVSTMTQAAQNTNIPSLYDYAPDLMEMVVDQQEAQIKAQQAAAKAAQKKAENAKKEAENAKKEAQKEAEEKYKAQKKAAEETMTPTAPAQKTSRYPKTESPLSYKDSISQYTSATKSAQEYADQRKALEKERDQLASKIDWGKEEVTGFQSTDGRRYSQLNTQINALKLRESAAQEKADTAMMAVKSAVKELSEAQRLQAYMQPGYTMDKEEKSDAKAIMDSTIEQVPGLLWEEYAASHPAQAKQIQEGKSGFWVYGLSDEYRGQPITEIYNSYKTMSDAEKQLGKSLSLFNSGETGAALAAYAGFLSASPAFTDLADNANSATMQYLGMDESVKPSEYFSNLQQNNPLAYGAGAIGGTLAEYAAGAKLMQSIPRVSTGLQKVGQALGGTSVAQKLSRVPILGHAFTPAAITDILGDQIVDTVLDTGVGAARSAMQGEDATQIAQDAAASFGGNLAANIVSSGVLGTAGDWLAQRRAARQAANAAQDASLPALDDAARQAAENAQEAPSASVGDGVPSVATYTDVAPVDSAPPTLPENLLVEKWRSGTLTNADIETLKPGGENRAAFESETGVRLPSTSSETRRFLKQEVPNLNSVQAEEALQSVSDQSGSNLYEYAESAPSLSVPANTYAGSQYKSAAMQDPQIPNGFKERGYAESLRNKSDIPNSVKQEFIDNPEIYKSLSNADTAARAEEIYSQGLESATVQYRNLLDQKDPSAIPLGKMIADDLISQGKRAEAVQVLREMAQNLTKSGQFSQAAAITLLKEDPMTALEYVQRQIDRMNVEGAEKFKTKWKDFSLTPDEIDAFGKIEFGDEEALKRAFESIGNRIAKEYPVTFIQKLVEATHISMLLNPRTNIRNAASNIAMLPVNLFSRKVSAAGQNIYKYFDSSYTPTQAFYVNKESKNLASKAFDLVRDNLTGKPSGKWENTLIDSARNAEVFKLKGDQNIVSQLPVLGDAFHKFGDIITTASKKATGGTNVFSQLSDSKSVAENLRQFTYGLLELGDQPFVRKNFVDRMASYIQAKGYKSLDEIPDEAFQIATEEAMKATFKDDNMLTRLVSNLKKNTGVLGEVAFPFTKTPANIAMRSIDYSPAGLVKGIYDWVKNGGDPSTYIDEISKGVTGTAGIALGALLYNAGIITGPESDDPDQAQYDRMMGKLPYSINVMGNYYTFDWMQPASGALILGSTIASQIEKDGSIDGQSLAEIARKSLVAYGDTLLDMSPLQSLSDMFGGYGTTTENIMGEFVEFPQRLVPSALGAVARSVDPVQRQTFSNGDPIATQIDSLKSKLPYLSQTLPASYDTWGREITRGDNVAESAFSQLVNPGQFGNYNPTPMDDEINRLYESTGDKNVFPPKAKWSVTYGGQTHKMSNDEYSEYQRIMGETAYDSAFSLMDSDIFGELDDSQKVDALQSAYQVSRYNALRDVLPDYTIPATAQKQVAVYDEYGAEGLANWITYKAIADADGNGAISQDEAQSALSELPTITNAERAYFWQQTNTNWKKNPYK